MRNMLSGVVPSVVSLAAVAAIAACGGSNAAPADPSHTSPASTSTANIPQGTTGGPTSPGDPMGIIPTNNAGATSVSGAPASPAEGKCKSGEPSAAAKDLDACLKSCKGLDDQVPVGSKCIPASVSCTSQCNTKFKKP